MKRLSAVMAIAIVLVMGGYSMIREGNSQDTQTLPVVRVAIGMDPAEVMEKTS
ncbi:MAG: hypothetical protein AAGB12_04115 [Pseudomonadota bacterium]